MGLITKLFGTRSEREIKRLSAQLSRIEALEQPYRQLSDEQLKAKTPELKARLAAGETKIFCYPIIQILPTFKFRSSLFSSLIYIFSVQF